MVHTDIGLSEVQSQNSKLKNFVNLDAINSSVSSMKKSDWRQFPELTSNMDDTCITIEYCTNCKQHQSTTRHSEEQYFNTATMLKQAILLNYPSMKVYLKPLLFSNLKNIETIYLQRRIGAFEVQMQSGSTQTLLFSKLKTKVWPDINAIIRAIHLQSKRTNFMIQLEFDEQDENLKDIPVTLTQANRMRSSSFKSTTLSSVQNRTKKSSSFHRQRAISVSSGYTEKSDTQGRVLFQNLPVDRFDVEIRESQNYKRIVRQVCIQDLMQDDGAYLKIYLQKPENAVLRIEVSVLQELTDLPIPCSQASVVLIDKSQFQLKIREISPNSGIYEEQIESLGYYQLIINKFGYSVINQSILVKGGRNILKIPLQKAQPSSTQCTTQSFLKEIIGSQINLTQQIRRKPLRPPTAGNIRLLTLLEVGIIQISDRETLETIGNAKLRFCEQQMNKIISCSSNGQGTAKMLISSLTSGYIIINAEGYYEKQVDYGIGKEVDLKQNRKIEITLIKTSEEIDLLFENEDTVDTYKLEGAKITQLECKKKQENLYRLTNLNITTQQALLFIELQEERQVNVSILSKYQVYKIEQPKIDFTKFPKIWLIGYVNRDNQYFQINKVIDPQDLKDVPNYIFNHNYSIARLFPNIEQSHENYQQFLNESCYESEIDNNLYHKNTQIKKESTVIDVIFDEQGLFIIFDNGSIIDQEGIRRKIKFDVRDSILFEIQINQKHIKQPQEIQFEQKLQNIEQIKNICLLNNSNILVVFQESNIIGVYDLITLNSKGYTKLQCDKIIQLNHNEIITIGEYFISLIQITILPSNIQFIQLNQINIRNEIICHLFFQDCIYFGRKDGVLSVYDKNLKEQFHEKISLNSLQNLYSHEDRVIIQDHQTIFIYQIEQGVQIINQFNMGNQILHISMNQQNLQIIMKNQIAIFYNIFEQRLNYNFTNHLQLDLKTKSYIILEGCSKYIPIIYYLDRIQIEDCKLENEKWFIELDNQKLKPLMVALNLNNIKNNKEIAIYLYTKQQNRLILKQNQSKTNGIWVIGTFIQDKDMIRLHQLVNKISKEFNYEIIQYGINNNMKCGFHLQNQDICINMEDQLQIINCDSLQIRTTYQLIGNDLSQLRQMEDIILAGFESGKIQLFKKENKNQYYQFKTLQYGDKKILDLVIVGDCLIFSTEERKIMMISLINFQVEYTEIVDRSMITQLAQYQANQFVTLYEDGRLRLWKKEKNTKNSSFSQMRTVQTIKGISLLQIPWEQQNFLVGGQEKGQLNLYNIDSCRQIRSYIGGHNSGIIALNCISNQIVISGCRDGVVVMWNYTSGQKQLILTNQYPVDTLIRTSSSLIVLCNQMLVYHHIQ